MDRKPCSVDDILALSGQYWEAMAFQAAVRLDLFSALAEQARCDELAEAIHADEDALRRLLTALVAFGLVTRDGDAFGLTELARDCLVRGGRSYVGNIIRHQHKLVDSWSKLADKIVAEDRQVADTEDSFLLGMFDMGRLYGPRIVSRLGLDGAERLLDLGGGPGAYAIAFCRAHPRLCATVFDRPETQPLAEQAIAEAGLADRISFRGGDYVTERFDGSYDAVWASQILHQEGREGVRAILAAAKSALNAGGRIIVQDFLLEEGRPPALYPALFSLNMLLHTDGGRAYTVEEVCRLLVEAGFAAPAFTPLPGRSDLVIARKAA